MMINATIAGTTPRFAFAAARVDGIAAAVTGVSRAYPNGRAHTSA